MLSHWQPPHHYNSMPEGSNLVDGETCSLDNISIPHDRISIPTMGSIRLKSHTSMREELFRFSFGSQWLTRHLHRQLSTTLSRSDMASSLATHHQNLNGEHDQGRQPLNDNPSVPKSLHGQKIHDSHSPYINTIRLDSSVVGVLLESVRTHITRRSRINPP